MRKPTLMDIVNVLSSEPLRCIARVSLADIAWVFEGHFPSQAVLPGVIQLNWVRELATHWLGRPLTMTGIPQMKFVTPVTPTHTVEIVLTRKAESDTTIHFQYSIVRPNAEPLPASQGKVSFAED